MPEVTFTRVTNNKPSLLHLPDAVTIHDEKGPSPRPIVTESVSLMPGGNNVETAVWEAAKKNKQVQAWLGKATDRYGNPIEVLAPNGRPWLEEGGDTALPEGVQAPKSLGNFGSAQAVAHVDTTDSLDVLKRWAESEGRPEVKNAISRRTAALTGTQTVAAQNAKQRPR